MSWCLNSSLDVCKAEKYNKGMKSRWSLYKSVPICKKVISLFCYFLLSWHKKMNIVFIIKTYLKIEAQSVGAGEYTNCI